MTTTTAPQPFSVRSSTGASAAGERACATPAPRGLGSAATVAGPQAAPPTSHRWASARRILLGGAGSPAWHESRGRS